MQEQSRGQRGPWEHVKDPARLCSEIKKRLHGSYWNSEKDGKEANKEALAQWLAPSPFLLSQVAKTQRLPRTAGTFSLLLYLCPLAHNPLFHKGLSCYLALTHLSLGSNLGNVPCLDPA